MANKGEKVLIIDSDGQGNASISFGLNPDEFGGETLFEVLTGGLEVDKAIVEVTENIDLIPANSDMNFLDYEILTRKDFQGGLANHIMKAVFQRYKKRYDYILIDCPPTLSLATINALVFTNKVLIPYEPEYFSGTGLVKLLNVIKDLQEVQNKNLEIAGVVGNKVDYRTKLHTTMMNECKSYCAEQGIHMFKTEIPKSISVSDCIAMYQQPLTLAFTDKHKMYQVYEQLTKEICEHEQ